MGSSGLDNLDSAHTTVGWVEELSMFHVWRSPPSPEGQLNYGSDEEILDGSKSDIENCNPNNEEEQKCDGSLGNVDIDTHNGRPSSIVSVGAADVSSKENEGTDVEKTQNSSLDVDDDEKCLQLTLAYTRTWDRSQRQSDQAGDDNLDEVENNEDEHPDGSASHVEASTAFQFSSGLVDNYDSLLLLLAGIDNLYLRLLHIWFEL